MKIQGRTRTAIGIADAVDPDDDNDGVLDENDAFPLLASESVDTDGDGIGNNADTDDDGDGVPDVDDLDPLDPNVGTGGGDFSIAPGDVVTASTLQGQWTYYTVSDATDFSSLAVALTNLTGDIDLYIRTGDEPLLETYDCRSWNGGSDDEACGASASGSVIIGVFGFRSGSYTLSVEGLGGSTTGGGSNVLSPGETLTDTAAIGEWKYYAVTGAEAFSTVTARLTNLADDVDLYVDDNSEPTLETYDCRSWNSGTGNELCEASASNSIVIGVFGYRSGSFTLSLEGSGTGGTTTGGTTTGGTTTGGTTTGGTTTGGTTTGGTTTGGTTTGGTTTGGTTTGGTTTGGTTTGGTTTGGTTTGGTTTGGTTTGGTTTGGTTTGGTGDSIATGTSISGSISQGEWNYYLIENPSGLLNSVARLSALSADIDLYVRQGAQPTLETFDCRSWVSGSNDETCGVNLSLGGVYLGVHGYRTGDYTVSLDGEADVDVIGSVDTSNSSVGLRAWKYYRVSGSESLASVTADLTNLSADVDLYLKEGSLPSLTDFGCRSFVSGNVDESCVVSTNGGAVFVGVFGYNASSYSLSTSSANIAARKSASKPRSKAEITSDLASKSLLTGSVSVGGGGVAVLLPLLLLLKLMLKQPGLGLARASELQE